MSSPPRKRRLHVGFENDFEILKVTVTYLEDSLGQSGLQNETLEWVETTEVQVRTVFRVNTGFLLGMISVGLGAFGIALTIALSS